jgi:hypothetical protein
MSTNFLILDQLESVISLSAFGRHKMCGKTLADPMLTVHQRFKHKGIKQNKMEYNKLHYKEMK